MLPTALAARPAAHAHVDAGATVVVLPLVPSATQRASCALSRQANSTSLPISVLAAAALS